MHVGAASAGDKLDFYKSPSRHPKIQKTSIRKRDPDRRLRRAQSNNGVKGRGHRNINSSHNSRENGDNTRINSYDTFFDYVWEHQNTQNAQSNVHGNVHSNVQSNTPSPRYITPGKLSFSSAKITVSSEYPRASEYSRNNSVPRNNYDKNNDNSRNYYDYNSRNYDVLKDHDNVLVDSKSTVPVTTTTTTTAKLSSQTLKRLSTPKASRLAIKSADNVRNTDKNTDKSADKLIAQLVPQSKSQSQYSHRLVKSKSMDSALTSALTLTSIQDGIVEENVEGGVGGGRVGEECIEGSVVEGIVVDENSVDVTIENGEGKESVQELSKEKTEYADSAELSLIEKNTDESEEEEEGGEYADDDFQNSEDEVEKAEKAEKDDGRWLGQGIGGGMEEEERASLDYADRAGQLIEKAEAAGLQEVDVNYSADDFESPVIIEQDNVRENSGVIKEIKYDDLEYSTLQLGREDGNTDSREEDSNLHCGDIVPTHDEANMHFSGDIASGTSDELLTEKLPEAIELGKQEIVDNSDQNVGKDRGENGGEDVVDNNADKEEDGGEDEYGTPFEEDVCDITNIISPEKMDIIHSTLENIVSQKEKDDIVSQKVKDDENVVSQSAKNDGVYIENSDIETGKETNSSDNLLGGVEECANNENQNIMTGTEESVRKNNISSKDEAVDVCESNRGFEGGMEGGIEVQHTPSDVNG